MVSGTETDAFQRIEKLERELVQLRRALAAAQDQPQSPVPGGQLLATAEYAAHPSERPAARPPAAGLGGAGTARAGEPAKASPGPQVMTPTRVSPPPTGVRPNSVAAGGAAGAAGAGAARTRVAAADPAAGPVMRVGRAQVPPQPPVDPTGYATPGPAAPPRAPRQPFNAQVRVLKRGGGWSWLGAIFVFCCWAIWAFANRGHDLTVPAITFGLVLVVAAGLFALARVVGRYVIERAMHRPRQTARLSHLAVAVFLIAVGVAYLRETSWVISLLS